MLKVGYGVTQYLRGSTGNSLDGIGHYSYELYKQLVNNSNVDLSLFSYGGFEKVNELDTDVQVLEPYMKHVAKGFLFGEKNNINFPSKRPDIIHASDHLTPVIGNIPVVTTIMDAIPLSNPEWVTKSIFTLSKLKFHLWKMVTKRSDHIITPSYYSAQQVIKYFGVKESKLSVVPLAVDQRFYDVIDTADQLKVLNKYGVKSNTFMLSVGTLQPRKNIKRTLTAFRLLSREERMSCPLVVVGRLGWSYKEDEALLLEAVNEGWCYWLKRVPDLDLRALLQSAKAVVFPSLAEGFGLPVLESFASKTVVITSNVSSLPEVAGEAALLVDPLSEHDIAEKLKFVINSSDLSQFVNEGYSRCKDFTWGKNAEQTIKTYKSLLNL